MRAQPGAYLVPWLVYLCALTLFECDIFRVEKAKRRKFFDERGTVELLATYGARGQVQLGQAWQLRDFL